MPTRLPTAVTPLLAKPTKLPAAWPPSGALVQTDPEL